MDTGWVNQNGKWVCEVGKVRERHMQVFGNGDHSPVEYIHDSAAEFHRTWGAICGKEIVPIRKGKYWILNEKEEYRTECDVRKASRVVSEKVREANRIKGKKSRGCIEPPPGWTWSELTKSLRAGAGVSMKAFGKRHGFSGSTVGYYELGQRDPGPESAQRLIALAREYGLIQEAA